jgi:Tfp pilus assembly protein PilF
MEDRLKSLLELYEKDPKDEFVAYGIALEYISSENYETAEEYLMSILQSNTGYVPAYMQLAQIKEKLNSFNEAADFYRKGIKAAKEQGDTHAANEMEGFLNELE